MEDLNHMDNDVLIMDQEIVQNEEVENDEQPVEHEVNEQVPQEDDGAPRVGQHYASLDTLYNCYLTYARREGFSVAKRSGSNTSTGSRRYQTISCDRGRKSRGYKVTKRIDCPARLSAILKDNGTWVVSKFHSEHNHDLDPSMSRLMRAHRSITASTKRNLEANDIAGIRPSKSVRLLQVQAGGPDRLPCLPKDCRNYIDRTRRLRLGEGDADCLCKMFLRMQQKNPAFFHMIRTDDEGRLDSVFWVHPRSRAAYEEFCDVVSVDSTYLVNRYKLPFVTIVGVNQHGHSILLGCALISHENTETYKWFFSTWLAAMDYRAPDAIMSDQCESIGNAIREVMPNTLHRYCAWHILCKIPEKFRGVQNYENAKKEFKTVIFDSLSTTMFETRWNQFIAKYGLEGNEWLIKLFNERFNWVPVYVNHVFWAGMLSTQRSEGMHAFFDGYVNSTSTLKQFVDQYEIAMREKVEKEFMADFKSKNTIVSCISEFFWEKQFQNAYTHGIFERFQGELKRIWYCHEYEPAEEAEQNATDEEFSEQGFERHRILERSLVNNRFVKEYVYTVLYKEEGSVLKCNCRRFESLGILCAHILKLVTIKDVRRIHERYLIRRWRKDVYRRHSKIFFDEGYPRMTAEYQKFKELESLFNETADMAILSNSRMNRMKESLQNLKFEFAGWNDTVNDSENNTVDNAAANDETSMQIERPIVRNPQVAFARGRPRGTRLRSNFERRTHNRGGGGGRGGRGSRCRGRNRRRGAAANYVLSQESHAEATMQPSNDIDLNLEDTMMDFDLNQPISFEF